MQSTRPRLRLAAAALALAALGLASPDHVAHALRAMPPTPGSSAAEVQTGLAEIEPQVQQCAASTATTRPTRVMVNVHLFPQGVWSVTFGAPHGTPSPTARGTTGFERCVAGAIAQRIGMRTERFTGARPRTISRRYRLVPPASAPTPSVPVVTPTVGPLAAHAAVVRRVLGTRRTQIQACFPHGARAPRVTVRMRVEVAPGGQLRITGLHMPPHLDFANVAQCIERAVDGLQAPAMPGTLRGEVPFVVQADAPAASAAAPTP